MLKIVILLLCSGAVAAVVSALFRRKESREARIFATKFDAYEKFASVLLSEYGELTNEYWKSRVESGVLSYPNVDELNARSAKVLLVTTPEIFRKIKEYNKLVNDFTMRRDFADKALAKCRQEHLRISPRISPETIARKIAILTSDAKGDFHTTERNEELIKAEEDMVRSRRKMQEAEEKLKEAGNEIMLLMRQDLGYEGAT